MKNSTVTIIAGPCSINEGNQEQLFDIAKIATLSNDGQVKPAIWGLRVVGLKSRTAMVASGEGMGLDFAVYKRNLERFVSGQGPTQFEILPSVEVAKRIVEETGLVVATEVVDPVIQLPSYDGVIPERKLLVWNPAVNQIGHSLLTLGQYAKKNDWFVGIKNGKWLGDIPEGGMSTMEKTWAGLASYAAEGDVTTFKEKLVMIHRGVDVAGKGGFRNLPVHEAAERIKENVPGKLFFDPSHTHGPTLRDTIVEETIAALKLQTKTGEYLYDGLLIEVGESTTDTHQHITIEELKGLCNAISTFRDIQSPSDHL